MGTANALALRLKKKRATPSLKLVSSEIESLKNPKANPASWRNLLWISLGLVVLAVGAAAWMRAKRSVHTGRSGLGANEAIAEGSLSSPGGNLYHPRPSGSVTFCKDVAAIVWRRCATCHRPGQTAPFNLLSYTDVKRRIKQIAEVTSQRVMPPWLPEPGCGEFQGDRRLSADELGLLQQWIADGAIEGNTADMPAAPTWPEGWFLGAPDLVVQMAEPYALSAEGRDVYRNFVIPLPLTGKRYVRAVEMRPGNARIVHHAFMYIDRTRQSRRLAMKESEPGFPRMTTPDSAKMPDGQFLTYQPGKFPSFVPSGLSWVLEKDSDLVLQIHMNPTGKPELLQASVGFYFTDQPPTNTPFKIILTSATIDIPEGEPNYQVTDSFTLPVEASVIAVLPHAHYLAREMRGDARLPDGTSTILLWIRNWDFKWQGDYQYSKPFLLPKGTVLTMRFTYDNSTNNPRNPNQPPKPVIYGAQSIDEMAELSFQVLVRTEADRQVLAKASAAKMRKVFWDRTEYDLHKNPKNVQAHVTCAQLQWAQDQTTEALEHLSKAISIDPACQEAHFVRGVILLEKKRLPDSKAAFEEAIHLDPADYRAHGNLGRVCLLLGQISEAVEHLQKALLINPDDSIARQTLEGIKRVMAEQSRGRQ